MTLKDDWEENKENVGWVKTHRIELMEETGIRLPRSRASISRWLNNRDKVNEMSNELSMIQDIDEVEISETEEEEE